MKLETVLELIEFGNPLLNRWMSGEELGYPPTYQRIDYIHLGCGRIYIHGLAPVGLLEPLKRGGKRTRTAADRCSCGIGLKFTAA